MHCTVPAVTASPVRLMSSRVDRREHGVMQHELHQLVSAAIPCCITVLLPDQHCILSDSGNVL